MAFTQNFNYCMEQRGYSAYKFAQIIGASNQGVLNWQSGDSKPYPKTQKKIADHFGITVEALNGEELPSLPPQGAKKDPAQKSEVKALVEDLPENIQRLIRICVDRPDLARALLSVAQQIENEPSDRD